MNPIRSLLHCSPEVVCVKVSREFRVDIDDVHVALCCIADYGFIVLACCFVGFDVNAECAVEFEFESGRVC